MFREKDDELNRDKHKYCAHHGRHHAPPPPPKGEIIPRVMHLSRMQKKHFNKVLNEEGIFAGQEDIIFCVCDHEGITLNELSNVLKVSNATTSVSVKRMEKGGFIVKKPDEKDARIIRLYPTEKAKKIPLNIKNKLSKIDETLTKNLDENEKNLLSDLLDKAIKNLEEEGFLDG